MFVSTRYIGLYPFSGTILPEDSRSPFCVRRPSWIGRDAVRPINVQPTGLLARELAAGKGIYYRGVALSPDKRLPPRAASTTWRMASVTRPGCSTWM
jgi:hypothetical protein